MPPKIDAPALKWLGVEFRKLLPEVHDDSFEDLLDALSFADWQGQIDARAGDRSFRPAGPAGW